MSWTTGAPPPVPTLTPRVGGNGRTGSGVFIGFSTDEAKLLSKRNVDSLLVPGKPLEKGTLRLRNFPEGFILFAFVEDMKSVRSDVFTTVVTEVSQGTAVVGLPMGIGTKTAHKNPQGVAVKMISATMETIDQIVSDLKVDLAGHKGVVPVFSAPGADLAPTPLGSQEMREPFTEVLPDAPAARRPSPVAPIRGWKNFPSCKGLVERVHACRGPVVSAVDIECIL